MERKEFFDKIDNIRQVLMQAKREGYDDVPKAIGLLQELREDAEQMLDDEHDAGYNLGLERGVDE